jgi:hypothetical protein
MCFGGTPSMPAPPPPAPLPPAEKQADPDEGRARQRPASRPGARRLRRHDRDVRPRRCGCPQHHGRDRRGLLWQQNHVGSGPSARYSTLNTNTDLIGSNLTDAGGTGSDNTSIWLKVWGDNTVHGVFPKGSKAGLQHNHLGEQTLIDGAGGADAARRHQPRARCADRGGPGGARPGRAGRHPLHVARAPPPRRARCTDRGGAGAGRSRARDGRGHGMSWLTRIAATVWPKVVAVAAALASLLALAALLRKGGADGERAKVQSKILHDVEKRHEIDLEIARDPAPAERLQQRWRRD